MMDDVSEVTKLVSLARVGTGSSTYEIETLPRILRMAAAPLTTKMFFLCLHETPSQPHPNAFENIYISQSRRSLVQMQPCK